MREACKEERNCGLHGASTDLCKSQKNQLLNHLRCAYATDDERDQLSCRIDVVDVAYIIPADRELDAGDEPCNAQDNADIPQGTEDPVIRPVFALTVGDVIFRNAGAVTALPTWRPSNPASALHVRAVHPPHLPASLSLSLAKRRP